MPLVLDDPRVLVTGSRAWPARATVHDVLDRLLDRYGERLVVIEGRARGADMAAHDWCERRRLGPERHRCYPVDWPAEQRRRPDGWRQAGHDRNTRMLLLERPRLVVAFHHRFDVGAGGTSDMCLKGLLAGLPVWLVAGPDPLEGHWLRLDLFPGRRVARARQSLESWAVSLAAEPRHDLAGIELPGPD